MRPDPDSIIDPSLMRVRIESLAYNDQTPIISTFCRLRTRAVHTYAHMIAVLSRE